MSTLSRILFVISVVCCSFTTVQAQVATDLDHVVNDAVLARLSDTDLRALVGKRLAEAEQKRQAEDTGINPAVALWRFQRDVGSAKDRLTELLEVRHRTSEEFSAAWQKVTGPREGGSFPRLIISFVVAFLLGLLIEFLARRVLTPVHDQLTTLPFGVRLSRLGTLFLSRLVGIVIFGVVTSIVWFVISGSNAQDRTLFFFYLGATLIVRFSSAFISVFYAPAHPELRFSTYSNSEARGLHRGLLITVVLSAFAFFTCALFGTMGIRTDAHPLLLLMVGNLYVAALCVTVFIYRKAYSRDLMAQTGRSPMRQVFANAWPWVIIAVTLFVWIAVAMTALNGGLPLYGAALYTTWVVLFYPTVDAALERQSNDTDIAQDEVVVALIRVVRMVLCVVMMMSVILVWRVNLFSFGGEGGVGQAISQALLQITMTLLVAYAVWQSLRIWIDRKIAAEDAELLKSGVDPSEMEIGGTGLSRTRTLLPLLKMSIRIALGTIVLMMVLSALGVNIAPILAGAGVLGLAIGFGSQTLVRDIVSGGFFLIDDAFRIGEYVDIGEVKGTVEKIQMRSLRLRHHRGAVHTIPFGEISHLTNYSRDWAIMKLKFRLPFDTDIEKVRKILKKVGQKLLEHPDIGDDFIQPFKSQGVLEVDDYGLVIRAKFMCKPGTQFLIRRHAYVAVQQAFLENGIQFAKPEIQVASLNDPEAPEVQTAAATVVAKSNLPVEGT